MENLKQNKKVLFVTTPIRPVPTEYPPYAVLSQIHLLKSKGYDNISFYNIDYLRPSIDIAVQNILESKIDVLAISAVVSTAYSYVKQLTLAVKNVLPNLPIILGGPMGASSEILLKKTGVDYVCISEGETVIEEFINNVDSPNNMQILKNVKGLTFLENGIMVNTGYADPIDKDVMFDCDFEDFESDEERNHYLPEVDNEYWDIIKQRISKDNFNNIKEEKRKYIYIPSSKGCVAKCTFCHRWDKGIRYIPVVNLMNRFKILKNKYNVYYFRLGDENFGTDRKWLTNFCKGMKKEGFLWEVGGMRVNCVSDEIVKMMKDSGCVRCVFGMETGSEKMLKIMNKGVKLSDNYSALDYLHKYDMTTTPQLVLGMPGETNETVKETSKFFNYATQLSEDISPFNASINYAQSLPGTPLYEFARHNNLIGKDIDSEEEYLLWISDKNAANADFSLDGLTNNSKLTTLTWRSLLISGAACAFIDKFGKDRYLKHLKNYFFIDSLVISKGYFNLPKEDRTKTTGMYIKGVGINKDSNIKISKFIYLLFSLKHPLYYFPRIFYQYSFFLYLYTIIKSMQTVGYTKGIKLIIDFIRFKIKPFKSKNMFKYQSLRKMMKEVTNDYENESEPMRILRKGRW